MYVRRLRGLVGELGMGMGFDTEILVKSSSSSESSPASFIGSIATASLEKKMNEKEIHNQTCAKQGHTYPGIGA